MTQRRGRPRQRFARGPRRASLWVDTEIDFTTASGSSDEQDMLVTVDSDIRKGMTLVRTILDLAFIAISAGTGSVVGAGIYLATLEAFAAGALAEPEDPTDEMAWVWRHPRISVFTSAQNDSSQVVHIREDLKGRRRVPDADYSMVWRHNVNGTTSVNIDGLVRQLWLRA